MQKFFCTALVKSNSFLVFVLCLGVVSTVRGVGLTPYFSLMYHFDRAVLTYADSKEAKQMSFTDYEDIVTRLIDSGVDSQAGERDCVAEEMVGLFLQDLQRNLTNNDRDDVLQPDHPEFDHIVQDDLENYLSLLKTILLAKVKQEKFFSSLGELCLKFQKNGRTPRGIVEVDYDLELHKQSDAPIDYEAWAEFYNEYDRIVSDLCNSWLQECISGTTKVAQYRNVMSERMCEVAFHSFNGCQVLEIKKFSSAFGKGHAGRLAPSRSFQAGGVPLWFRLDRGRRGTSTKKVSLYLHQKRSGKEFSKWPSLIQVQFFAAGNAFAGRAKNTGNLEVALDMRPVISSSSKAAAATSNIIQIHEVADFVSTDDRKYLTEQSMLLGVAARGVWSGKK
ncbi:hypothetical protein M3P05_15040 [Sansalvadorimonas sp. 2012CJ34-2]|uniref:Uncharacterized protein n=1 Tax=Parendozoicomonas callyspongiae TaxID=2942213 RepID=A0ABT0PIQ3_9GAMM|nr:hypothetical protein [Sansalvadorimonas sp. 2012CJ34-2]MCL6271240.1 hypothetical protein [Sansalvadorimonas sp. 2012CJ34-2]